MRTSFRQRGFFWIPAAITAAATIAASRSSSRASRLANEANAQQSADSLAAQREFAQNGIQWRVADAQKAGVHPLFALSGGGASYQPAPFTVMPDNSQATAIQNFGNIASRLAQDYYSQDRSSELYGPPASAFSEEPVATSWSIPGQSPEVSSTLHPQYTADPGYGFAVPESIPSMARWDIPGLGQVIAPYNKEKDFSQALEGVESPIGQALIFYLNRHLGERGLAWLGERMGVMRSGESVPGVLGRLARSRYWSDPVGAGMGDVRTWLDSYRR